MSNRRSRGPGPWSRDACTGHRSARRNRPDAGDPLRTRDPCPPGRAGIRRLARHRAPHGGRIRCHRRGPVACSGRSGLRGPGVTDRSWTPRVRHGRGKLLVDGGVPGGAGHLRRRRPERWRVAAGSRPAEGGSGLRSEAPPYDAPVVPRRGPRTLRRPDPREGGAGVRPRQGRAAGRASGTAPGPRVRETSRPCAVSRSAYMCLPNSPYSNRNWSIHVRCPAFDGVRMPRAPGP